MGSGSADSLHRPVDVDPELDNLIDDTGAGVVLEEDDGLL